VKINGLILAQMNDKKGEGFPIALDRPQHFCTMTGQVKNDKQEEVKSLYICILSL
jgi:hypothetical protein